MTRGKSKRAGTRGGTNVGKKPRPAIPDDLPDAAEAALDDLLSSSALMPLDESDEPGRRTSEVPLAGSRTQRGTSEVAIDDLIPIDEDEEEDPLARPASRRLPSRVAPLASAAPGPSGSRSSSPAEARYASAATSPAASPAPPRSSSPRASTRSTPTPADAPSAAAKFLASASTPSAPSAPAIHFEQTTNVRPASVAPIEEEAFVEEQRLVELTSLSFAIYEDSSHLASAQSAVAAAGHVVAVGAAGRDGAKRVIDAIREGGIDVVLVGLPGGEAIIDAAIAHEPHRPTIIGACSGSAVDAVDRANAAGADLATTRPHELSRIAPLALAAARLDAERRIALSAKGAEQVLRQRLEDLADAEPGGLLPFEMFQRVLELEIKRAKRFEYPLSVALFAVDIPPPPPPAGIRGILRARAGNALINTIRDIDMATQLDHERFLVLLPYTDLTGAATVGRRVIASVSEGDPVISAGRSFPPRLVGAVAGMRKGEAVSFSRLMKDATRALEQARKDGAELAVQP